jgi:hypothetical protein
MDYGMEKLKEEFNQLNTIWKRLYEHWEKPLDFEDLYRIYPYFSTVSALIRQYSQWSSTNENMKKVKAIKPSDEEIVNTSKYCNYDEHTFFNGKEIFLPMDKVASLFLHRHQCSYMDDRLIDGKMKSDTNIFLYISTDDQCRSCVEGNGGKYKENRMNLRKTSSYVGYSDCTCGYYIHIQSYIDSIDNFIRQKNIK